MLVESFGFQSTFLITAGIKAVGFAPVVPLMWLVDSHAHHPAESDEVPISAAAQNIASRGSDKHDGNQGLRVPLLSGGADGLVEEGSAWTGLQEQKLPVLIDSRGVVDRNVAACGAHVIIGSPS
jgi:hypothetical protein